MRTRVGGLLALALSPVLALTALSPAGSATAAPSGAPAADHASAQGRAAAERALSRAEALFDGRRLGRGGASDATSAPAGRDATLVLRDLAAAQSQLSAPDRETARRLLARPGSRAAGRTLHKAATSADASMATAAAIAEPSASTCDPGAGETFANLCVHWFTRVGNPDTPPLGDGDGDGLPDQVELTGEVFEAVWRQEVDAFGYRPPLDDSAAGTSAENPNGLLDIYLADLGADGVYGFCATDEGSPRVRHLPAYCAVDNDFAASQFGTRHTAKQLLQVTAAHEFFHAVQFGYDWLEDLWLMESTATWIEDEVYDDIDDNRQYLVAGPMRRPRVPLDLFDENYRQYGGWILWRYLSERLGGTAGAGARDHALVKAVWDLADGGRRDPGLYSTQAARQAMAQRGLAFASTFDDFAAANRFPGRFYSEGRNYPHAPLTDSVLLTRKRQATGWHTLTMRHLTNAYVRFTPGRSLKGSHRLRLTLDLPRTSHGSAARVDVHGRDGSVSVRRFRLNADGNGHRAVSFTRSGVAYAELTLTNASTRFVCDQGFSFSCGGRPKDDGFRAGFKATVLR